jgi:hypothetical protein
MGDWKVIQNGSTKDFADDFGYKVEHFPGTGMPPLNNIFTNFALLDGSTYQRTRAENRVFSLIGTLSGSSVSDLHLLRKNLIDVVKPDRTASPEAIELQYTGAGSTTLQGSVFYDAGLEFGQPEVFSELQVGLRFVMPDPYWEAASNTASLALVTEISNTRYFLYRDTSGSWQSLDSDNDFLNAAPTNGVITRITESQSGILYAAGQFTEAGTDTDAQRIAQFDGTDWRSLASTAPGNRAEDIVLGPDDVTLYICGAFTSIGGSTSNRLGVWDASASSWTTCSTGFNAVVNALAVSKDNVLYATGDFTTAGGTAASYIAEYDGNSWNKLGTNGLGNTGSALAISNNLLYVGGTFDAIEDGTISACNFAIYDISTSAWLTAATTGGSLQGAVNGLAIGLDKRVYAGGAFTQFGASNSAASRSAVWNDVQWQAMGTGLDNIVNDVEIDNISGGIYAVGTFTTAGGVPVSDGAALWNLTTWIPAIDVDTPGLNIQSIYAASTGELYLGLSSSGTASAAGITSITNNGTAIAYPILNASGPGRLYQLVNYTTKDKIYFDLVLNSGETIALNLKEKTFTSSFRGNIVDTILPSSNLATWKLIPGSNNISLYLDDSTASATIEWTDRLWSLDGGV